MTPAVTGAVPPDMVAGFAAMSGNQMASNLNRQEPLGMKPPGKPVMRPLSNQEDARFTIDSLVTIQWTRSSGEMASDWSLMLNGQMIVNRQPLAPQQIQSGTAPLPHLSSGSNSVLIQLCNASGCTSSDSIGFEVQGSVFNALQKVPDAATVLPNTHWAGDRVTVHWRGGNVPATEVEITINGMSMKGRVPLRPGMGQSGSETYFYQGDPGNPQAVVGVMLCNAWGCTPSSPYPLTRLGTR